MISDIYLLPFRLTLLLYLCLFSSFSFLFAIPRQVYAYAY